MSAAAIFNDFRILLNHEIDINELGSNILPTYILYASDDEVVSIRKIRKICENIKFCKSYKIQWGGHNFFISNPEECIVAIKEILKIE